ncbi:MAG: hypothetical protein Q9167_004767 [Letrouitia subvulpina]
MNTNPRKSYGVDLADDATASLILQLQEKDIEQLLERKKGKGRQGVNSDADIALLAYQKELQETRVVQNDRSMSRSLALAVTNDAELLNKITEEENIAAGDRALAIRLAGKSTPSNGVQPTTTSCTLDDGLVARMAALYVPADIAKTEELDEASCCDDNTADAESSSWAGSRQSTSSAARQCVACGFKKPLFDNYRASCGHDYCQSCLETLFELSTTDESLFPPRCCRSEISLQSVKLYLSPTLFHHFEQKSIEFTTSNRTYCFRPTCSAFIPPVNIVNQRAVCSTCGSFTCTICKNEAHTDDCPKDTTAQQVLDLARDEGWQRCFGCRRIVELDVGCNHIRPVGVLNGMKIGYLLEHNRLLPAIDLEVELPENDKSTKL